MKPQAYKCIVIPPARAIKTNSAPNNSYAENDKKFVAVEVTHDKNDYQPITLTS